MRQYYSYKGKLIFRDQRGWVVNLLAIGSKKFKHLHEAKRYLNLYFASQSANFWLKQFNHTGNN